MPRPGGGGGVWVDVKLSAVVDAGDSGGTDPDLTSSARPLVRMGEGDSSAFSPTLTALKSRGGVEVFSADLGFRIWVGLVGRSVLEDLVPAGVDVAVEEAAVSTAAEGLGGRDEAGGDGRNDAAAIFLSPPRALALVGAGFASLVVLDSPDAVADTDRPPLDVVLAGRPFGTEGPANVVAVAGASNGVPPF